MEGGRARGEVASGRGKPDGDPTGPFTNSVVEQLKVGLQLVWEGRTQQGVDERRGELKVNQGAGNPDHDGSESYI